MKIFLDGYNFIFRVWGEDRESLEERRRKLLLYLADSAEECALDIDVAFDSVWEQEIIPSHYKSLKIVFSAPPLTADDLLLSWVEASQGVVMVVTNDRKLALYVKHAGAVVMGIDEFRHFIQKKKRKKRARKKDEVQTSSVSTIKPISQEKENRRPLVPGSLEYYIFHFEKHLNEEK